MVSKKPRIVIIGAGVAGLTAASKLHAFPNSRQLFELTVVEGGDRIGGRVSTASFCGDRIEQGATWIHGIDGSPVYDIARQTNSLHSDQPWECMDGPTHTPLTAAEGGHIVGPSFVQPISDLFEDLMDFVQGKPASGGAAVRGDEVLKHCVAASGGGSLSVGAFLQKGLEVYWAADGHGDKDRLVGNWSRWSLQRAVFAMHEGIQRTFTSADDLRKLDYNAEKDYVMFPGEEITMARGYSSVVDSLASALPAGMIQLGRRVDTIEWRAGPAPGLDDRPVKLRFADGSAVTADHVIVTVSLGVLKQGITGDCSLFSPPLPDFKTRAISRLGYGVVDKVFLKLGPEIDIDGAAGFPYLQMLFHPPDSELRSPEIPEWIRKTSFLNPIYGGARVVLSWFTGPEALKLESLDEDEIISGFEATVTNLLPPASRLKPSSCNGNGNIPAGNRLKFERVLRTQWGSNPLFLGSYSYVAVGSSIDDMDTLAEPLPKTDDGGDDSEAPLLQILFAGEATHRTHYSTTHGAYFSGLREANRLLKHYNYNVSL
ncbi:Probable polyamine oxidase 5 [Striga hermonthica]|uniref:Probable polyamine oxidase 5 n=1 Tax=Striga hermonthica TaxID=68872 RepID=A0A9N7P3Q5_STRHE|nr:Probable polyamine oxidase 5 [Striga hermonthica]